MSKLLLITQAVDPADSALGFFCEWIEEMARDPRVASIDVWCLRSGEWMSKPANVQVAVMPPQNRAWWFLSHVVHSRFDAVFVHMSPIWVALGGWWWRLTKQRIVLWYTHGSTSMALRIAMKFANVVCTATKEAFPIKSEKVMAIGHGISSKFVARSSSIVAGKMELLSVGRITQRKRVKETIEFFSLIRTKRPDAHLTWIGEPLTDADRAYAAEIGSPFAVTFAGKKRFDELPSLYANANALLHLSATGSLDKVVIEALAAGCPVFSTNPATREAVPGAFWDGALDQRAAEEVIRRAEEGMTMEERQEIATRFSLATLIKKIVDQLV